MGDIARFNKELKDSYGTVHDGRPRFRVVWSSDQTEKRIATFCDWYGHILIRRVHECREVLKYPFKEDKDKWVLETLLFQPWDGLPESANGHYEPVWIFKDARTGGFKKPNMRAIHFIVHCLMEGPKKTVSDRVAQDREAFEREWREIKEILANKHPYLATVLHDKRGIVNPGFPAGE